MARPSNPHSKRFYPAQEEYTATGSEKAFTIMYEEVLAVSKMELGKFCRENKLRFNEQDSEDIIGDTAAMIMKRYRKELRYRKQDRTKDYKICNLGTVCKLTIKAIVWRYPQNAFENNSGSLLETMTTTDAITIY